MKTTSSQFKAMIAYMERYGDLALPGSMNGPVGTRGSKQCHWEELTNQLNNMETGVTRNPTKWRKVWTDFKANTKKKAYRIEKYGPTPTCVLTDLEKRTLLLMIKSKKKEKIPIPAVEASLTATNSECDPLDSQESTPTPRALLRVTKKEWDPLDNVEQAQAADPWTPSKMPNSQPNTSVDSTLRPVMRTSNESEPSTSKSFLRTSWKKKRTVLPKLGTEEFHAKLIECFNQQLRLKKHEIKARRQRNIQRKRFEEEMIKLMKNVIDSLDNKMD